MGRELPHADVKYGGFVEMSRFVERICRLSERDVVGVIQAFFDESGREGDCPYALFAGAVASPQAWDAMSIEWNATLTINKDIPALDMVDAMSFNGHFKTWKHRKDRVKERADLLARLAFVLENHIEHRVLSPHEVDVFRSLPERQQKAFGRLQVKS